MRLLLALALALPLSATTYYVAPSGSGGSNCTSGQSAATPLSSMANAWSCAGAGDTISVANGSYSSAAPPTGKSGTSGSPITVQAATDGGVTFTGGFLVRNSGYLTFQGIRITGITTLEATATGSFTHHVIFQRMSFYCSAGVDVCVIVRDGSHHNLFEDFWATGGGRYIFMVYGGPDGGPHNTTADNNTLRRGVIRQGPETSSSGNPQAGLSVYYAGNNIVENVIVLDNTSTPTGATSAGFYLTGHGAPPTSNSNKYYGILSLNNDSEVGWYEDCAGATCSSTELRNSVVWAGGDYGIYVLGGTCTGVILDHNTSAESRASQPGYRNDGCSGVTLTNNAFYSNGSFGAVQGGSGSTSTNNHNGYFGNTSGARSNLSAGTGDITTNPGFSYIGRIESASPYHNAGGTGDIGANLVNQYVDGSLTGTALWPWPNEARIKTDMCSTISVTRGWCGTAKTLTAYVWDFLGNGNPYASATSPTVTTTTASSVTTTTAASGGNVTSDGGDAVTSRGVCYATTSNPTTPCTSDGTGTGSFTSSLTGLSTGTLYHYRAFATNGIGTAYGTDLTFTTNSPASSTPASVSGGMSISTRTTK